MADFARQPAAGALARDSLRHRLCLPWPNLASRVLAWSTARLTEPARDRARQPRARSPRSASYALACPNPLGLRPRAGQSPPRSRPGSRRCLPPPRALLLPPCSNTQAKTSRPWRPPQGTPRTRFMLGFSTTLSHNSHEFSTSQPHFPVDSFLWITPREKRELFSVHIRWMRLSQVGNLLAAVGGQWSTPLSPRCAHLSHRSCTGYPQCRVGGGWLLPPECQDPACLPSEECQTLSIQLGEGLSRVRLRRCVR